ncbi:MAG: hypothetical protein ACM3ZQ_02430 [Bacillota bacterium]
MSVDLNSSSTPRPEECVTRLRISGPGPDEVRQWLRQLSQSERLVLVELQPTSRTVQFSIRGSADQITRIASQISTLVTVLQRETMVVDLKREWTAIQELIGQTRLEISRREEILRQTKVEPEIQQQEAELENSRNQLRNQEKTLRLLESRLGTAVLEIRY